MFLTVDDKPVSELGSWALGEWSTILQGPEALAWRMRPTRPDSAIRPNQLIRLYDGGTCVWSGYANRPNRGSGEMSARGLHVKAYETAALDGSGNITQNLDVAIDAAIARGALPGWIRQASLSTTAVSTDVATIDGDTTIGQLADAVADEQSKWWRVTANGVVQLYSRPTSPTWLLTPQAGTLDIVDGDYASRLYGRRRGSTGNFATEHVDDLDAEAATGYAEATTDLTALGYITQAKAEAILTGMLAKGRARFQFANGVEASRWQILTIGSVPAHLPAVNAGTVARFLVQHDDTRYLQGRGYVDELIGRVVHPEGQNTSIEVQPNGLVRGADWRDAIAYMTARSKGKR